MKIVLRKKDSVVSIILFIFNFYHELYGSTSMKLDYIIQCMSFFDKNETAARMGLSRMMKADILVNKKIQNDVYYALTENGERSIHIWNQGAQRFFKRYALRHQTWNQRWHMIAFLDPVRSDDGTMMDELQEHGFRELTRDLFISPYSYEDQEIDGLLKFKHLKANGEIALSAQDDQYLDKIFGLASLKKNYEEFIRTVQSIKNKTLQVKNNGSYLPLLFELGWNFFDVAVMDPALPESLLKDWIGDLAALEMKNLRKELYDHIKAFFVELAHE